MEDCKHGIMKGCCAICLKLSNGSKHQPGACTPTWLKTIPVDNYAGRNPEWLADRET